MEKQSLIKYYCAVFLVMVLFAGSNYVAVGQPEPTLKPSVIPNGETVTPSPAMTQNSLNQDTNTSDGMSILPIILSILALVVSGGAIALTILKNKQINERIASENEKYNQKVKLLDDKYTELLAFQATSSPNQLRETNSRNSKTSNNPNVYLEERIDDLSVRISELEDKLQAPQINKHSTNYSKNTFLSKEFSTANTDINPFSQIDNISQANMTQSLENLAYIELVNTYNNNPKLLEQKAIKVSEPTDSINRRHTDSSQKIVLEKANNSNYWVIHDEVGIDCWLLPKSKLRIDQFRYETTKALFECNGYQPEYYSFKLVKPAKVIPLSTDEQTWQLEEPGILEFNIEA